MLPMRLPSPSRGPDDEQIRIKLTPDEALVLSDWLERVQMTDLSSLVDDEAVWAPIHRLAGTLMSGTGLAKIFRSRPAAGACRPRANPDHLGIEVHHQQPVPLQPRLEADVPPGRRRPIPAREVTLTPRPANRTHRSNILEPARHTVPQRTPAASVHLIDVRQLDARQSRVHPSRYSHPAPPAHSAARLGSLRQKPERLGSLRKRLD